MAGGTSCILSHHGVLLPAVRHRTPRLLPLQGILSYSTFLAVTKRKCNSTQSAKARKAVSPEDRLGVFSPSFFDVIADNFRYGEDPVLLVERAAAPLLGIKGYGVHMNGYVRKNDRIYLWVATRSANKPTWPSQLDHIAAGGQV